MNNLLNYKDGMHHPNHLTLADNTDQNVQPNSTLACNEL